MEADEIKRIAGLPGRVISCGGGVVLNKEQYTLLSPGILYCYMVVGRY